MDLDGDFEIHDHMVALLIGVSQEEQVATGQCMVPCRSPQVVNRNVKAMSQVLQHPEIGQLSQSQITELINPTPDNMGDRIKQLFLEKNANDLRLLYFFGSAIVGKTGKLYLCAGISESSSQTQQNSVGRAEPTMISLDWVLQLMEESHGDRVAVILDCVNLIDRGKQVSEKLSCRSFNQGALLSHLTLWPRKISRRKEDNSQALLEKLIVKDDFPTYTDFLVAGLATGEADLDGDGSISLGEWHSYAENQFKLVPPATLPKLYATGNADKMAIAHNPAVSANGDYRDTVAEIAKRYDGNLPIVAQRSLMVRRDSLGVHSAIALSIKKTVFVPYLYKRAKLELYQEMSQAISEKQGSTPTPETGDRLKSQQVSLGLTDAEVAEIVRQPIARSENRNRLPWAIMATVTLGILCGGAMYAMIRNLIGVPTSDCQEDSCVAQPNESKPSKPFLKLPAPPETPKPPSVKGDSFIDFTDSNPQNGFPIPTKKPITLTDHQNAVQAVAIAPNRQMLVTGSSDKTIKLWNLPKLWEKDPQNPGDAAAFLTATLRGHTGRVRALAISSDSQTLASGSNDNTIKLWNLAPEGETGGYARNDSPPYLRSTLTDHVGAVYALAFLPDRNILISGSADWTIKIWDLTTQQTIKTLRGHQGSIRALAVSADGHTLVSGSKDGTVKVWDLNTRRLKQTLRGHDNVVRTVAISPDGQTIASGSWDRTIKIWRLEPPKEIGDSNQELKESRFLSKTLKGHRGSVNSLVFSPDGQTLISGSDDNTIKIWQLDLGKPNPNSEELVSVRATLTNHSGDILSLAVSAEHGQDSYSNPLIVSGSWDKTVKIWR